MSASRTIGVIRPPSIATATEMSTRSYWSIASSVHEALQSGMLAQRQAQALITRSLTETLASFLSRHVVDRSARAASSASISKSTVR